MKGLSTPPRCKTSVLTSTEDKIFYTFTNHTIVFIQLRNSSTANFDDKKYIF